MLRYGEAVHKAWHQAGFAPELLACERLPGGWLMVTMERLGDQWHMLQGDATSPARQAAMGVLQQAHQLPVYGHGR